MANVAVKVYIGSTSTLYRVEGGMVLKSLHPNIAKREAYKVTLEKKLLERLGEHPRIVKYKGFRDAQGIRGLLFAEASHGDLQSYIDQNNDAICPRLRKKWCWEVTEAIQYLHWNGIIHSDLRPENCLLHQTRASLDVLLCDFGGSMCHELGLDGRGLPDPPFWNLVWNSTPATDIFSLGSTFYTIMTGHWPYKSTPSSSWGDEDKWAYEDRVIALLKAGVYPEVEGIFGGGVMMGCWTNQYITASDVLQAEEAEMLFVVDASSE